MKGCGGVGLHGAEPGDLYVSFVIRAHQTVSRTNGNAVTKVREAQLIGTECAISGQSESRVKVLMMNSMLIY